ncbi:MAG: hypothetical protein HC822_23250 [Oscillochloris sp.]|nr:hypothetical protein [Oscillochloris sp.]
MPEPPSDVGFDRLAGLAARFLQAPMALISVVTHDRRIFKGQVGLDAPFILQVCRRQ